MAKNKKQLRRQRIRRGLRKRLHGTTDKPRLSVFRSNEHIYAQLIDDDSGHTLASASSLESAIEAAKGTRIEVSREVGKLLAARAKESGVEELVFDRNTYRYHGRVKALAEGVREGGITF
jgi:large subunit ribosomal protein L18